MAALPTFPQLSRSSTLENSRVAEDGTLRDPMESGYVATRPRFTRTRRRFGLTYKFLTADDVVALDAFEQTTVAGGAGAFTMPSPTPTSGQDPVTVRLTKPMTIKEMGWAGGQLRYSAAVEVVEV